MPRQYWVPKSFRKTAPVQSWEARERAERWAQRRHQRFATVGRIAGERAVPGQRYHEYLCEYDELGGQEWRKGSKHRNFKKLLRAWYAVRQKVRNQQVWKRARTAPPVVLEEEH